ncbi:MAG: hypothetical protein AAGA77_15485 [Bacteroidota bacterium]
MPTKNFTQEMIRYVFANHFYKAFTELRKKSLANEQREKYYVLNATANVMISTTSSEKKDVSPELVQNFQLAQHYFSTISASLKASGISVYDYKALNDLINASNHFFSIKKETKTFEHNSAEIALNTAFLNDLMGSMTAIGGALNIGKKLLESIGNEITLSINQSQYNRSIGHLLFACEDLMGIPVVSLSLFHIHAREGSKAVDAGCAKKSNQRIQLSYTQEVFMFINPDVLLHESTRALLET